MAAAPPAARDTLCVDLRLASQTVKAGVVPSRNRKAETTWTRWCLFCTNLNVDPYLSEVADPVSLLQVFGLHWRNGHIAPSGKPNQACSVEDAIQLVRQKFPSLGGVDPRLDTVGKQDFRLTRMYSVWKKVDSPPRRVGPVPMPILLRAADLAMNSV